MFQGQPNDAALQNEYIQNMMAQRNAQREAKAKAALDAMNGEVTSAAAGFSADSGNGDGDSKGGGSGPTGRTGTSLGAQIPRMVTQDSLNMPPAAAPVSALRVRELQSLDLRSFLLFPLHLPF